MNDFLHMKRYNFLFALVISLGSLAGQTPAESFLNQYDERTQEVILTTLTQAFSSWTVPGAAAGYLQPYETSVHLLADLQATGELSRDDVFTLAHYVLDTLTDAQLAEIATLIDAEEIFSQEFINKYGSFSQLLHGIFTDGQPADSIHVIESAYELGIIAGTLTYDRLNLLQTLKSQLSTAQLDYLSQSYADAMAATPDTLGERLGEFYGSFTDERQVRMQYFAAILMAFVQPHDTPTRSSFLPFWGWSYFDDYFSQGTLSPVMLGRSLLESFTPAQMALLGLYVPQLEQMDSVLAGPDSRLSQSLAQFKTTGVIDETQYFEDITNWYLSLGIQANRLAPFFGAALCSITDEQVTAWSDLANLDLLTAYREGCPVSAVHEVSPGVLRVHPNPIQHTVYLNPMASLTGAVQISIWNSQGQRISQHHYSSLPASLDASDWPSGLLFMEVNNGKERWTGKLVKH